MATSHVLTVGIWIILKIIYVLYIPLSIIRLFFKRKVCPPITNDLLLLPATKLAEKIRNREITSERIVKAYIERISEVNPFLNAVIEDRFQDAINEAKEVEKILKRIVSVQELEEKYPLLGVPITIKGSIAVEGLNHSAGVLKRNKKALKDAECVKRVKEVGAIPILVSNTPEFCLNWETTNKLIGTTNNPYDSRKSVGGSSGGEGALISAGASVIGIGSDIAGSLRIPMHHCGVWGHKPTPRLISVDGHYPDCPEDDWPDVFQIGPISRYASDLQVLFEILVEPSAKPKLQKTVDLKKLKVYYLKEIKNCIMSNASLDSKMAVDKVVKYFNNYTETSLCKPINGKLLKHASELSYLRLLLVDNIDNLFEGKGEGAHWELLKFLFCLSKSVFTTIGYGVLRWWLFALPESHKTITTKKLGTIKKELTELLDDQSVLILPTFISEAPYHHDVLRTLFDYGYCSIFNSLGLPSTQCPVGLTSNGMPVGVQVVGAPNSDRLCLAVAKEIETALGGWKAPTNIGKFDLATQKV